MAMLSLIKIRAVIAAVDFLANCLYRDGLHLKEFLQKLTFKNLKIIKRT